MTAAAATATAETTSAPLVSKDDVLAQFREFEERLAAYDNIKGRTYDLDNPRENKTARSDRLALGKTIAELDRKHAAIKAPLLDATRLVDGERKRIKDALLDVQASIKDQIDAHEQRERDRVAAIQARIADIREQGSFAMPNPPSAAVLLALENARAVVLDDSWQEFRAEAALARTETIEALERLLAERQKAEAEAAELARLRAEVEAKERQECEERIRREAAEAARAEAEAAARAEAERVEQERRQAEERAEREREAAAAKARAEAERIERERRQADERAAQERARLEREKAEAQAAAEKAVAEAEERAARAAAEERERIEREQAEKARKAEQDRKADEARKAKQQHRAKIHGEVKRDLIAGGLDEATATGVVEMIRDGKIAHVAIAY